jgi:hypothetical protein
MLLALHMLALGVGTIMFVGMIILHRRARAMKQTAHTGGRLSSPDPTSLYRPAIWLSVRSPNPKAVQAALGISYSSPCPWTEGIGGEHEFFIGPPVSGWIIVTGSGLPQPSDDVDRCFHFLVRVSRVLGHVQLFMADPVLHHHAWARVENGVVKRAYVWVGETVWNQGVKSLAETELNMTCFGYGEDAGMDNATMAENAAANVEKIPSLAARWSFDPATVAENLPHPAEGVAGKSSQFYKD